jgi:hypothetical protein
MAMSFAVLIRRWFREQEASDSPIVDNTGMSLGTIQSGPTSLAMTHRKVHQDEADYISVNGSRSPESFITVMVRRAMW